MVEPRLALLLAAGGASSAAPGAASSSASNVLPPLQGLKGLIAGHGGKPLLAGAPAMPGPAPGPRTNRLASRRPASATPLPGDGFRRLRRRRAERGRPARGAGPPRRSHRRWYRKGDGASALTQNREWCEHRTHGHQLSTKHCLLSHGLSRQLALSTAGAGSHGARSTATSSVIPRSRRPRSTFMRSPGPLTTRLL
jgi:hypothetical protein